MTDRAIPGRPKPPPPSTLPAPPSNAPGDPDLVDDSRAGVLRVNRETKNRKFKWAYVSTKAVQAEMNKVGLYPSTADDRARIARGLLGAPDDAPVRESVDGACVGVWRDEGSPTEEPLFPAPKIPVKEWAIVSKAELKNRAQLRGEPVNYHAGALDFFGSIVEVSDSAPRREHDRFMAVWLHGGDPEGEPSWPSTPPPPCTCGAAIQETLQGDVHLPNCPAAL